MHERPVHNRRVGGSFVWRRPCSKASAECSHGPRTIMRRRPPPFRRSGLRGGRALGRDPPLPPLRRAPAHGQNSNRRRGHPRRADSTKEHMGLHTWTECTPTPLVPVFVP